MNCKTKITLGVGVRKVSNSKRDLQGHSVALVMMPIDRPHTISYSCVLWFDCDIRGLALATVNRSTKFEISNSTHDRDTKGKISKKIVWLRVVSGHSKSLQIAPFDKAHTSSY